MTVRKDWYRCILLFFILFLNESYLPPQALAQTSSPSYDEPYRPQFHFTPAKNWMNDPNGLVYYKGEYHLFYQYNPFGNSWGHMSWGHAVSRDLVHWQHLPVALAEENGVMIFSGSAVVDWQNSSGLCRNPDPKDKSCLIAIYTGHIEKTNQSQHLAVSNDRGRTWTKFAGNPVLDIGYQDFRDPKVIWHAATKQWVMVVSLSKEQKVRFYGSPDLKQWKLLSEFGPAGVKNDQMLWECPDLFELPVANQPGQKRWVLIVNINPGGVAGGSGGQYFIGKFDGKTFTNDNPNEQALFVDYGADFYAGVTFSDVPKTDGRRILIGWMSNWQYAGKEPTETFRTAQSIPRVLGLRRTAEGLRLTQRPIAELTKLRKPTATKFKAVAGHSVQGQLVRWELGEVQEVIGEFILGEQAGVNFQVFAGGSGSETVVGYDGVKQEVFIDRTHAGQVSFDQRFPARHAVPLTLVNGRLKLHLFIDRSSVEVFANDGAVALTDRIFPVTNTQGVWCLIYGRYVEPVSLKAWQLRSIWSSTALKR